MPRAAQTVIQDCDAGITKGNLTHLTLTPMQPVKGQPITMSSWGPVTVPVNSATYDMVVTLGGVRGPPPRALPSHVWDCGAVAAVLA